MIGTVLKKKKQRNNMNNILNEIGIETTFSFLRYFFFVLGSLAYYTGQLCVLSVEIMLNAVNLLFVAFSTYHQDAQGQILFFSMAVAAAEVAVD
jgi:NADH-quinone oxidoreductase subunit K